MIFSQQCRVNSSRVWRLVQSLLDPNEPFLADTNGTILEFPNEQDADDYISKGQGLIDNSLPTNEPCSWCIAKVGDIHSPACPNGERYKQVQDIWSSGHNLDTFRTMTPALEVETPLPCDINLSAFEE